MLVKNGEQNWEHGTIALRAGIGAQQTGDVCLVWSSALRRNVRMDAAEWAFLAGFAGGVRVGDQIAKLASLEAGEVSDDWHLAVYLRIRKYLALGLLVEQVVLAAAEIAQLYFCPKCADGGRETDGRCRQVSTIGQSGGPEADGIDRTRYQHLLGTVRDSAARSRICSTPLQVCWTRTGRLALLGNVELAALAVRLGLSLRVQMLGAVDWFSMAVELPAEFFGTMRGSIPYQSVIFDGEELIPGRRRDLNERLDQLDPDDLRDKAVLDLGCNIGMNCFLAVERGARAATGIDLPALVGAATRLNAVYEAPCRFLARDLSHEVTGLDSHDTVLAFALIGHVASAEGLLGTIRNVKARTVYVESHCEIQEQGDLNGLLSADLFSSVEFRGYCQDNVVRQQRTRRLFRCVVQHGR